MPEPETPHPSNSYMLDSSQTNELDIKSSFNLLLLHWFSLPVFILLLCFPVSSLIVLFGYAPVFFYLFYKAKETLSKENMSRRRKIFYLILAPCVITVGFLILLAAFSTTIGINVFTIFKS